MYRKKFGLLQKDLAEQLGVSADTVRNWELGHSKPSPQNLQKLAEMVKLPQRFLLVSEAEFPHRFLLVRRRLALSQAEIASHLRVTRDTISNWERGRNEPRGETRERVDQLIEETLHGGESVAARVWEIRMRLGMSQSELADRLGVGRQTVSRWERGKRRPSEEIIERLKEFEEETLAKED